MKQKKQKATMKEGETVRKMKMKMKLEMALVEMERVTMKGQMKVEGVKMKAVAMIYTQGDL